MKILVIEDEHRIAHYIKKGLELKSYVVDVVYDGQKGYDIASTEKYDLIILDRMLPSMEGVTICNKLREEGNHIPIIMLTAKTDVTDRVEGLESGADDYLGKPFAFVELLARIKTVTRRPKNRESSILQEGTLLINTDRYTVERAGKSISLSGKEYALLEYFMRHKNHMLSKDKITEEVWSYDSDVLPNTAQVYIGYLRNKLEKPFPQEPKLIHTVRGFGYKFGILP
ncbi:response regulator transcription factor [Candidatus Roizmanbacteria bacterium]|nr:response regulator transcription factor [Candidatus Roizmanbacteria bacterium]